MLLYSNSTPRTLATDTFYLSLSLSLSLHSKLIPRPPEYKDYFTLFEASNAM